MVALEFNKRSNKFKVKWDIATLPEDGDEGWSGAGVWGSQPAIDPFGKQVFFATGNVYSFPPKYAHCANQTSDCMPKGVNQEAVIAIDITSGRTNWVRRVNRMDAWNGACFTTPIDKVNCPSEPPGTDSDFGMAPSFIPRSMSELRVDAVVVAQKNANIYALSSLTGEIIWQRNVSPDKQGGGISWGIAMDDKRIYYSLPYSINIAQFNVSTSVYGAASLKDGSNMWQTSATRDSNSIVMTPPTVVGELAIWPRTGVVGGDGLYFNSQGALIVIDKKTGEIIKEMDVDTNFNGGIAVHGEYVMFGTGYRNGQSYLGNGSLYVMTVG